MTTPACGHDDGWCGVLGSDSCVRTARHHGPEDTTDYETLAADHAEKRWQTSDDYHERSGAWSRD